MAGKAQSGDTSPPIAVQRAYDFALWLVAKVEGFPRSHRFTVGDRLIERALDLLENLALAAYSSDRKHLLEQANRSVTSLRLLIRLSYDLRLLGGSAQEFAAAHIEEIGRMIGGWRKADEALRKKELKTS